MVNEQRLLWNWSLNRTYYNGMGSFLDSLRADNATMMYYTNPSITPPVAGPTPEGGWQYIPVRGMDDLSRGPGRGAVIRGMILVGGI